MICLLFLKKSIWESAIFTTFALVIIHYAHDNLAFPWNSLTEFEKEPRTKHSSGLYYKHILTIVSDDRK